MHANLLYLYSAELLRTSVDEDILSSTYTHITSSPACTSPMDVDFDTPLNEADLKGFSTIPLSVTEYSNQREGGSINTPPPPPPPPPPTLDISTFSSPNDLEVSLNKAWNTFSSDTCDGTSSHDEDKRGRMNDSNLTFASETSNVIVAENQEGVDHLKKKIEDLQRELITTQRRLEDQQKRSSSGTNVRNPKEISRRNSDGASINHIISHESLSKTMMMLQQQYPSHYHTLHLKSDCSNEQRQLDQNSVISSNHNVIFSTKMATPFHENTKLPDSTNVLEKNSRERQVIHLPESVLVPQPPIANQTKHLMQVRKSDLRSEGNCSPSTMSSTMHTSRSFRPDSFVIPGGVIISSHHRYVLLFTMFVSLSDVFIVAIKINFKLKSVFLKLKLIYFSYSVLIIFFCYFIINRTSSLPNFSNSVHLNGKPSSSDVTGNSTTSTFSNESALRKVLQSTAAANSNVNREIFIQNKLHLKPPPNYSEAIKQCKAPEVSSFSIATNIIYIFFNSKRKDYINFFNRLLGKKKECLSLFF